MVSIELTPGGRRFAVGKENIARDTWSGSNTRQVVLKLCDMQFVGVTGITAVQTMFGAGDSVEYQWKYAHITPFGKAQMETMPQMASCKDEVQAASVGMQLYDDGWRIIK